MVAMSNVDFGQYKRIVQAFWDPEPKNDDPSASPIWCIGEQYPVKLVQANTTPESPPTTNGESDNQQLESKPASNGTKESETKEESAERKEGSWPSEFLDDCEARAWFTYRSSFPSITKSSAASMTLSVRLRSLGDQRGFTSDTGWGCMIRSGQSLLANALFTLRLGREWRRGQKQEEEKQIISLFSDNPDSPFSIHRFVDYGASDCGKHPGEWFGPSATAHCIRALSDEYDEAGLKVYINGDGPDVYEDRFLELAKPTGKSFKPTLILVQIRLGIDRLNPIYLDGLKDILRLPQSVGIAGGRPASSLYFFAFQGDQVFYLDPHFTRPALPYHAQSTQLTQDEVDSCHTRRLRRLPFKDMDPSMLIAFLIKDENDWKDWRQALARSSGKPIVHIADREPVHGLGAERPGAVDDVETFDDEDEEDDGVAGEQDRTKVDGPSI